MLFSLGRTACSGGDLRETLLSSRHPEKETLRRAEDTPGRSLLRSQIIAPLAQLGGQTWGRRMHGEDVYTGSWSHFMANVSRG